MSAITYLTLASAVFLIGIVIGLCGAYCNYKEDSPNANEKIRDALSEQNPSWEIDVLYKEVDSVITYDEFIKRFVENKYNERNCSNFTKDGFYFYECGAWGLGNLRIGFKTKEDLKKYRKWLFDKKCELEG